MGRKSRMIFTLLFAFIAQIVVAQEATVKGTVTGSEGLPLIGVTIIIKGTHKGTQTDFDGNYEITVKKGAVLVYSYLGFETEEEEFKGNSTINVILEKKTSELSEVIILGYVTKSEDELTGVAAQIKGQEIAKGSSVTLAKALQGKVSGVTVSAVSGMPGAIQDIRIRGISSLTASNNPLYVVNGIPILNENISASADFTSLSPLAAISSDNIESVTILKDAAATAAYGARGANGVIVITTKSGEEGEVVYSVSSSIGVKNEAYNKRKMLTGLQKLELLKESLVNSYGFTKEDAIKSAILIGKLNPNLQNLNTDDFLNNPGNYNWANKITNKNAFFQNYTFSASGGTKKGAFYASLGYSSTEATVIGGDFERIVGVFNFDRQLSETANLAVNMNVSNVKQNPILEQDAFFSNPFTTRYLMNPLNAIYNPDGTLNTNLTYGALPNTLYVMENNYNRNMLNRGLVSAKLDWDILENLTLSNSIGIDYQFTEYRSFKNAVEGDGDGQTNGLAEVNNHQNFNYVYQGSLKYDIPLNEGHNLDITGLFEYQKNESTTLYGYGENFPTKGLSNISTASDNFQASSSFFDWYNISYLGLLSYDYLGKYVVDLTYRREGSSKFAEGSRFGNFGAVGFAWNIDKETFVSDVFSRLKFRASAGITGNSGIEINLYQPLLGFSGAYDETGAGTAIQFGNPYLTWEKNQVFDIGVDFGLWKNRLSGSFSYYSRRTYDLLYAVPLSKTTGFDQQIKNSGEMTNNGFELTLGYDIVVSDDFLWNINGNFAKVKNKITELPLGPDGLPIDRFSSSVYKTDRVGLPTGTWFMRTWAGVDPATGAPTWYVNGRDGAVTSNYLQAKRVTHGASLPTFTGSLSTRLEYKGFFVDASVYFAGGHQIYEQFAQFYLRTNAFTLATYNGAQALLNRWQKPGDITNVPKLDYAGSDNFSSTSTRHLYEGDYLRLKHLSIGYELPAAWTKTIGFKSLSIVVRGANLATWVKDKGLKLDPAVGSLGYTTLSTPPTKAYTIGINAKF